MLEVACARVHADRPDRRRPAQEEPPSARHPRPRDVPGARAHPPRQPAGRGADRDPVGLGRDPPARGRDRAAADVPVKTLPGLYELISGDLNLAGQIRPVQVEDVLGREPSRGRPPLDREVPRRRDRSRHGRGGSIGAELCRQIARIEPARLVLVEQSESGLFDIERELIDEREFSAVATRARRLRRPREDEPGLRAVQADRGLPRRCLQTRRAPRSEPTRGRAQQRACYACDRRGRGRVRARRASCSSRPTRRRTRRTSSASRRRLCEWIVEAYGHRDDIKTRFVAVRFGNVLNSSGQRHPDLPAADREGRPRDRHASGDDALLHDHSGGRLARRAGGRDRRPRPGLRPRHGRAGQDHRPCAQHDPALGKEPEREIPISFVGVRPGGEAARGALDRGRDSRADVASEDPPRRAVADRRRAGWKRSSAELERMVARGDTLDVVSRLASMLRDPRRVGVGGPRRHAALDADLDSST